MSFILDALKKSEIERQRQTVPGLMDTRIAQQRSRLPVWAVALGILLGINLIVLAFILTRSSTPHAPAMPQATSQSATVPQIPPGSQPMHRGDTAPGDASPPPTGTSSATTTEHFSPLDPTPTYAPEIPVTTSDSTAPQPPTGRPAPSGGNNSSLHALRRPDPLLTDKETIVDDGEVLPSISEMNLTGGQTLPELHLDVHVYATKPADRFVYINMRKYHEGATLQEGPTVEHIRRDGVVLDFQGLRFILPRQP